MSRTDVHRPWRVQVADPHNRHILYRYQAFHNKMEVTSFKNIGCGCQLCTGHFGRKLARRQERVKWNAVKRDLIKTYGEMDVPLIYAYSW